LNAIGHILSLMSFQEGEPRNPTDVTSRDWKCIQRPIRDWLAERFESNRTHLLAVADRMLGSLTEADDAGWGPARP
jgi:hypothetical protein